MLAPIGYPPTIPRINAGAKLPLVEKTGRKALLKVFSKKLVTFRFIIKLAVNKKGKRDGITELEQSFRPERTASAVAFGKTMRTKVKPKIATKTIV